MQRVLASELLLERDQPEPDEEGLAEGIVHVTGPGTPPGTETVVGRLTCALRRKTSLPQSCGARGWSFPLPPEGAAQPAPQPAVQFLENPFRFRQPEIGDPAAQDRGEVFDGGGKGATTPTTEGRPQLALEPRHT